MPHPTILQYDQLQSQMLAMLIARTGLSDVADTSIAKHLTATVARSLHEFYYQLLLLKNLFSIDRATGEDLDERAKDIQPGTLTRLQATRSAGEAVFSRTGTTGSTVVPQGTQVKTASGQVFQTTAVATIGPSSPEIIPGHGAGRDIAATIAALVPGAAGNVAAGTIVKFQAKPAGVAEVTNVDPTLLGTDQETDDQFRQRLKNWVSSLARSTVHALESAVLGAVDPVTGAEVKFAKVIEDNINLGNVTLYVDDGAGTSASTAAVTGEDLTGGGALGGETVLFTAQQPLALVPAMTLVSSTRGALTEGTHYTLNSASGQVVFDPALVVTETVTAAYTYYTGLVALAQKIIDGDPLDRANFPGYRAAGVLVRCLAPQVVLQNVVCTVTVVAGYDGTAVQTAVSEAIKTYINSLSISGDVLFYKLVQAIMGVAGVENANVSTPTGDVVILDDQIVRTTDANIEVVV